MANKTISIPLKEAHISIEDEAGYVGSSEFRKKVVKEVREEMQSDFLESASSHSLIAAAEEQEEEDGISVTAMMKRRRSNSIYVTLKTVTESNSDKVFKLINKDAEQNDDEKMKTLREIHQSLTLKREVKAKLEADIKMRRETEALDRLTQLKLRISMAWHKFWNGLRSFSYSLELWNKQINVISGRYGSGVAAYFSVLQWLVWLNTLNSIVIFFFLCLPQMLYHTYGLPPSLPLNKTMKALESIYEDVDYIFNISELPVINPELYRTSFRPYDLLTGEGALTNSAVYLGHYSDVVINLIPGVYYSMPLAYIFVMAIMYLLNFVIVAYNLTVSYEKKNIDTSAEINNIYANKIFSSWDFTIATDSASNLRKKAFATECRELLDSMTQFNFEKTLRDKFFKYGFIVLVHIFIICGISATSYFVLWLIHKDIAGKTLFLSNIIFSVVVTAIVVSSYFTLKFIGKIEYYLPKKTKFYFTIVRVTCLRCAVLGVVIYFWMFVYYPPPLHKACFETELGQNIYQLFICNFIAAFLLLMVVGVILRMLSSYWEFFSRIGYTQFDTAYNILDLIYYQSLVWLGMAVCPLLPPISVFLFFLLFYMKVFSVHYICKPPRRFWSASEAKSLFFMIALATLVLSSIVVGYIFFYIHTPKCGPFRAYSKTQDVLREAFLPKGSKGETTEIIRYLTSPGLLFTVFSILCVALHFMRAKSMAHATIVLRVREQLVLGAKDRVFLLSTFEKAMHAYNKNGENGHGSPPRDKNVQESSSSNVQQMPQRVLWNSVDETKDKNVAGNRDRISFLPNVQSSQKSPKDSKVHEEIIINEAYVDYEHQPTLESPLPHRFNPGYIPANVPANRPSGDNGAPRKRISNSPARRTQVAPMPVHRPGFQYLLKGEPPPRRSAE